LQESNDVEILKGDVLNFDSLKSAVRGASAVIHLAAIAGVSSYYKEPLKTLRVNTLGTLNVLEAMVDAGVRKIIDFSTSEVYGVNADHVNEEDPHSIGPVSQKRWVYATSKLVSEHLTLRYGEEYGLQSMCLRPFNIYGPGQTGEGAIRNFAGALVAGKPITIYGDGKDVRAWCFIDDLVEAVTIMLKKPGASGMTFNIGNPSQTVTTAQLAEMMIRIYGKGSITYVEAEHTPIRLRIPDITRAKEILGFEPKVSLEEGLKKTLKWYKEITL
jgi:nucleoside-diphosphate-sugar epimerase